MPNYKYIAMSQDGKKEGVIEAPSAARVAEKLKESGLFPINISEFKASVFSQDVNFVFESINSKDILFFTRNLRTLLKAGLTITESLDTIQQNIEKQKMQNLIEDTKNTIANGGNLSEALKIHQKHFSEIYINMIKAGEEGGILISILERLVLLIEYEVKIKEKIKKATRYPSMVITAISTATIFLTMFVFPKFMKMFSSHGGKLPLPTKIMIMITNTINHYWIYIAIVLAISYFTFKKLIQTPIGKKYWDTFTISAPIFGPLIKKLVLSRLTKILAMLLESGLPILSSIEAVINTTSNSVIKEKLCEVKEKIKMGQGISEPLKESKVFPTMVTNMIAVGEKTGNVNEMLFNISEYYEGEANLTLDNLTVMLEPLLIVILSAIVLFVILAVYLPIINMSSLIK